MSVLRKLPSIRRSCLASFHRVLAAKPGPFFLREKIRADSLPAADEQGKLIQGDNLQAMKSLLADDAVRGRIALIYIDPPFFSAADYEAVLKTTGDHLHHKAYGDSWEDGLSSYLKMLGTRLYLMHELLAPDGLIYVHLDWHASAYVRIFLDEIFGRNRFVNEIVWVYKSGGSSKRRFARKHDTILVYAKSAHYRFYPQKEKSYNRKLKPYHFKGVEEFRDEIGWYTLVNRKDVWEIDMVGRTSGERTGYATQKPEALMRRIIASCTKEGDLVADFFCGSGSCGAAAAKMGRRFLLVDSSPLAVAIAGERLIRENISFSVLDMKKTASSLLKPRIALVREGNALIVTWTGLSYRHRAVQGETARNAGNVYDAKSVLMPHSGSGDLENAAFAEGEAQGINRPKQGKHAGNCAKNRKHMQRMAERETIEAVLDEEPFSLLLEWSVDFDFDGENYVPDLLFVRRGQKEELPLTCKRVLEAGNRQIAVRGTDIFGNVLEKTFVLHEEM